MKQALYLLLLLIYNTACTQIYYVNGATGSDNNSGLTLGSSWKTIQKAANTALPGSTIFIRGGTYHENVEIDFSGLPGIPTVFRNYNNETVYIDGTGTSTSDGTALIRINGASHLEFRNLTLQNLLCTNATGIRILPGTSGATSNIKISNIIIYGIKWTSSANTVPSNGDNAHPIVVYGSGETQARAISNITIEGCTIYGNVTGYSESLTISGNVDGFLLKDNIVRNNSNVGIDIGGYHGVSPNNTLDRPRNGVIKGNKTFGNLSPYSTAAGIYIDGAYQVSVENNESYNNSYGIEIGCEENGTTEKITVKDNIFYNNVVCGIYLGGFDESTTGQVLDCTIRNNTIFQNDTQYEGNGELQISKASNCHIENNIFYTNTQQVLMSFVDIEPSANNSFDYNCWFTPNNDSHNLGFIYPDIMYTSFSDYRAATGQDAHSFYGDPKINSSTLATLDMSLQANSPCIDAANQETIISIGETCFSGLNRLFGTLDIGAYEFPVQLSTAINKQEATAVSPVPATEFIYISSNNEISRGIICDLSGKILLQNDGANEEFNISVLPTGLYVLKLHYTDGGSSVHKIVKK
ncbi:MAG TPA: right-handed parallel beta-helix repeat-containing protein [Flavobacterium sp.]|jgi:hypothetical protein